MDIVRNGAKPSSIGGPDNFTGHVLRTPLFGGCAPSRMTGGIATFEPGARTVWHTHPIGQILIITFGRGRVQVWGKSAEEVQPGAWCGSLRAKNTGTARRQVQACPTLPSWRRTAGRRPPGLSRSPTSSTATSTGAEGRAIMQTKRHDGRNETILDPGLPIIDAHHHLFDLPNNRYMLDDFLADAQGGHNVVATVFCETQSFSLKEGPEWLRPLNEVEVANGIAALTQTGIYGKTRVCAGIVGHANLTFGARIGELLDRCMAVAPTRFRGVRHVTVDYPDDRPFRFIMTYRPPPGLLNHPLFPEGLAELSQRGLTFDAAIYDPSLPTLTALVDRFSDLQFVLDHQGVVVGLDMAPPEKAEVFGRWRTNLRTLAERPNVACKIGGLGMPVWGFGFEERPEPIGYEELATAWRPYVESAIEAFGADRCMMESNFPPDGRSCGYIPLWNALKHIVRGASAEEKTALFSGTATRIYRLDLPAA
jgi:predicted TIM-barrel fold metal-dependent hydrolase